MISETTGLHDAIRARFAHVTDCPFEGPRVFFENAGGALTLKSVVETSARFAAIPDNQGRDNPASQALDRIVDTAKDDIRTFFNAPDGSVFVGESGTELSFRLIADAILGSAAGGIVLGSTVEHPASRSACTRWAAVAGKSYVQVPHDAEQGLVTAEQYRACLTSEVRVATIVHTSPVTGMAMDVAGIAQAIRDVAPEAFIIVDGIQHASHGHIDVASYDIDGYVISPYKVFSRHGYGVAWASDRLSALPHNALVGGPENNWEMGTRDTGSYATMTDVVAYFDWLGGQVSSETDRRRRIESAAAAIHRHEASLTDAVLHGTGNLPGLANIPEVTILGGVDNPAREGLVSFALGGHDSARLVRQLGTEGIRVHLRRNDHYSGTILKPLGLRSCIRLSMCHYNSKAEVAAFLSAMQRIVTGQVCDAPATV